MLILVAISINVIVNSNLISESEKAGATYENAVEAEQKLNPSIGGTGKTVKDYLEKAEIIITENDPNYSQITIPAGFMISGIENEQSIEEGLVIYEIPEGVDTNAENFWTETTEVGRKSYPSVQCNYNQYVWVPVETPYVTAGKLAQIISNSNGTITTETEAMQSLVDGGTYPMAIQMPNGTVEYYREPAKLSSTNTSVVYQTREQTLDMQTEYNNIVKSVKAEGGFWVARYELSYNSTTEKGESKRGKIVANAGDSTTYTWYGLYRCCKGIYQASTTGEKQSAMIYGSQWDQIMIWMKDIKNTQDESKYYILDSSHMGNYATASGGIKLVSGYSDSFSVKKIFDLGGNLWDWISEANNTYKRVMRGDDYDLVGYHRPVSDCYERQPVDTNSSYSSRSILYIMH